jgi:hypothetical protein
VKGVSTLFTLLDMLQAKHVNHWMHIAYGNCDLDVSGVRVCRGGEVSRRGQGSRRRGSLTGSAGWSTRSGGSGEPCAFELLSWVEYVLWLLHRLAPAPLWEVRKER